LGPEILGQNFAPSQISRGNSWEFPSMQNSAKSFSEALGALRSKGANFFWISKLSWGPKICEISASMKFP
jgi:hypothetical protein